MTSHVGRSGTASLRSRTEHGSRAACWLVVFILLAAFALRLFRLGEPNVWWDEGLAFWAVRQDVAALTSWTAGDVHPPMFFWLLWAQVRLAGESEFAARFLSVAAGLTTVAAVVPIGRLIGGIRVGVLAALVLALARFPVWWSQELRMYALATLFATVATYFLLRLLSPAYSGRGRLLVWAGYALVSAFSLWTLYLSAAVLLVHNLFVAGVVAIRAGRSPGNALRLLTAWSAAQIAVFLLFVPWLVFASGRMRTWSSSEPIAPDLFARLYLVVMATGISTDIDRYWPLLAAGLFNFGVFGLAAFLWSGRPRSWRAVSNGHLPKSPPSSAGSSDAVQTIGFWGWLLVLLIFLVPPAIVFGLTQPRGLFYSPRLEVRYFLLMAPAAGLLAAGGLAAFGRIGRAPLAIATIGVAMLLGWSTWDYLDARHRTDEYGSLVATLDAYAKPEDAVVLVSGDRSVVFLYHYLPGVRAQPAWYGLPYTVPATAQSAAGDVGPISAQHRRVWLASVEAHLQDPEGQIRSWLQTNLKKVLDESIGHNRLELYDWEGVSPELKEPRPGFRRSATIGTGRHLIGYDLPASRFFPFEVGHLALYWRSGGPTAGPVAIRLRDSAGVPLEEWIFDDGGKAEGELVRKQLEFAVHRYTPAGRYRITVESLSGEFDLDAIQIERTDPAPAMPQGGPSGKTEATLGSFRLLGYDLHSGARLLAAGDEVRPGEELRLALYWLALERLDRSWVAFAHLLSGSINPATGNPLWGQGDGYPLAGEFPTEQWRPGQVVRDERVLRVDPAAPDGKYDLEVGWYWPPTMERQPTADGTGRALLPGVTVKR